MGGDGWKGSELAFIFTLTVKPKLHLCKKKIPLSSLELYLHALAMQTHQDQAFCNASVNVIVLFEKREGRLQELLDQFSADTILLIADKEQNRQGYM